MRARLFLGVLLTGAAVVACSSDEDAVSADTNALSAACAGTDEVPDDIACTGLYQPGTTTLAANVRRFTPAFPLWTDGMEKDRYIVLPDGQTIDAANMDDWSFPVGTKTWKEFRFGPRKVETRFFWKVAPDRWLQAAYVWSEDGKTAKKGDGDILVDGKPYSVPKTSDCNDCHRGRKDKVLGFEALSLGQSGANGVTLQNLVDERRLSPAPPIATLTVPDPALGVLHINCGVTCHNGNPSSSAASTRLRLRLSYNDIVANKPVNEWDALASTVGVDATMPGWSGSTRIKAGAPEESLIVEVMRLRGPGQMPPLGTNLVDANAVGMLESWIRGMPR